MFGSPQHRQAKKLMRKAVVQAYLGMRKNHGGPFGAVIVRDGEVIAKAHNMVLKTCDPTAHAEVMAIRRAIYWAGMRKVYFGCTRKDAEKIGFRDKRLYDLIKKRKSPALEKTKVERSECLKPFEEWTRKKDRVIY
jgi:guanine deaminase